MTYKSINEMMTMEQSGGTKFDDNKVRMELLPVSALIGIAEVFTFGAKKYDSWNWAKGIKYSRLYGALLRHMTAWYKGEEIDPESGKSHLYHAGCCLMMLIDTQKNLDKSLDDRPGFYVEISKTGSNPE
jgi:hypothetical protein